MNESGSIAIRDARRSDARSIAALYAYYVERSVATFEEVAPSAEEIADRIATVTGAGFPWLLAVDGESRLLGYTYASPYRTRSAYRYTLESSVYVAHAALRSGLGTRLMQALIERCTALGYRQMLAVIGDSANDSSVGLHASLGFAIVGTHRAIGHKHGRWVDVVHMQLALGEGARTSPAA